MSNIVRDAKEALQGIVRFKPEPSIEDLFDLFLDPAKQRNVDKNDEIYVAWLCKILEEFNTKNVLALHMNKSNNDRLDKYLNPMTYLNYSPKTDDGLDDDELMIDLNEAAKNE